MEDAAESTMRLQRYGLCIKKGRLGYYWVHGNLQYDAVMGFDQDGAEYWMSTLGYYPAHISQYSTDFCTKMTAVT